MNVVLTLERLGYTFAVEGDTLIYQRDADAPPDPARVRPLLAELKAHKAEALAFVRRRAVVDDPDGARVAAWAEKELGAVVTIVPCWPSDPAYPTARTLDDLVDELQRKETISKNGNV